MEVIDVDGGPVQVCVRADAVLTDEERDALAELIRYRRRQDARHDSEEAS